MEEERCTEAVKHDHGYIVDDDVGESMDKDANTKATILDSELKEVKTEEVDGVDTTNDESSLRNLAQTVNDSTGAPVQVPDSDTVIISDVTTMSNQTTLVQTEPPSDSSNGETSNQTTLVQTEAPSDRSNGETLNQTTLVQTEPPSDSSNRETSNQTTLVQTEAPSDSSNGETSNQTSLAQTEALSDSSNGETSNQTTLAQTEALSDSSNGETSNQTTLVQTEAPSEGSNEETTPQLSHRLLTQLAIWLRHNTAKRSIRSRNLVWFCPTTARTDFLRDTGLADGDIDVNLFTQTCKQILCVAPSHATKTYIKSVIREDPSKNAPSFQNILNDYYSVAARARSNEVYTLQSNKAIKFSCTKCDIKGEMLVDSSAALKVKGTRYDISRIFPGQLSVLQLLLRLVESDTCSAMDTADCYGLVSKYSLHPYCQSCVTNHPAPKQVIAVTGDKQIRPTRKRKTTAKAAESRQQQELKKSKKKRQTSAVPIVAQSHEMQIVEGMEVKTEVKVEQVVDTDPPREETDPRSGDTEVQGEGGDSSEYDSENDSDSDDETHEKLPNASEREEIADLIFKWICENITVLLVRREDDPILTWPELKSLMEQELEIEFNNHKPFTQGLIDVIGKYFPFATKMSNKSKNKPMSWQQLEMLREPATVRPRSDLSHVFSSQYVEFLKDTVSLVSVEQIGFQVYHLTLGNELVDYRYVKVDLASKSVQITVNNWSYLVRLKSPYKETFQTARQLVGLLRIILKLTICADKCSNKCLVLFRQKTHSVQCYQKSKSMLKVMRCCPVCETQLNRRLHFYRKIRNQTNYKPTYMHEYIQQETLAKMTSVL